MKLQQKTYAIQARDDISNVSYSSESGDSLSKDMLPL